MYVLVLEAQKASISGSILFGAPFLREWGCTARPLSSLNQLLNKLMPWLHSALDFWLSLKQPEHPRWRSWWQHPLPATQVNQWVYTRLTGGFSALLPVTFLSSDCTFSVCSVLIFFHLIALCMSYPSAPFYPRPPEADDHPVGAPGTDVMLACKLWLKNCSTCACWNCLPGIALTY